MIITQTPFRMSFFGGGTDMENFFRENGGAVLSTTFDKYCYVNVRHACLLVLGRFSSGCTAGVFFCAGPFRKGKIMVYCVEENLILEEQR
mgnify:CR=1 FL=1